MIEYSRLTICLSLNRNNKYTIVHAYIWDSLKYMTYWFPGFCKEIRIKLSCQN